MMVQVGRERGNVCLTCLTSGSNIGGVQLLLLRVLERGALNALWLVRCNWDGMSGMGGGDGTVMVGDGEVTSKWCGGGKGMVV